MHRKFLYVAIAFILLASLSSSAQAQTERLCDTAFEDCRAPLWALIDKETVGIDIAYWFMQDTSIANKIIARAIRQEFQSEFWLTHARIQLTPATNRF